MTDLHLGWIILGFIAGALSGAVVGGRTARGCLPNVVVGILGAIVGGWLADAARASGAGQGFIAATVVAIFGAIVVRVDPRGAQPRRSPTLTPDLDAGARVGRSRATIDRMTERPRPAAAPPADRHRRRPALLAGPRGRPRRRDLAEQGRRRARAA